MALLTSQLRKAPSHSNAVRSRNAASRQFSTAMSAWSESPSTRYATEWNKPRYCDAEHKWNTYGCPPSPSRSEQLLGSECAHSTESYVILRYEGCFRDDYSIRETSLDSFRGTCPSVKLRGRCRHNCRLANFILHCTSNFATMDLTPRMIDQSPSQIPGAIQKQ